MQAIRGGRFFLHHPNILGDRRIRRWGGKPPVRPRSPSAAAGWHVDSPARPAHVRGPNRL